MNAPLQGELLETEERSPIQLIVVAIVFVVLVVLVPAVNPAFSGIFAGLTDPATNFVTGIGNLSNQLIDAGLSVLLAGIVSAPLVMNIVGLLKKAPVVGNVQSNVLALIVAFILNAILLTVQGFWPGMDLANLQNIALAMTGLLVGAGGTQIFASAIHDKLLPTSYPLAFRVGKHAKAA